MKDREKLITSITAQLAVAGDIESDFITLTTAEGKAIRKLLKEQQQIVRCKDCKHGVPLTDCAYVQCSRAFHTSERHDGTWFCADGERKGDANE